MPDRGISNKEKPDREILNNEQTDSKISNKERPDREMSEQVDRIREFFSQYEARFNRSLKEKPVDEALAEAKRTVECFSDCFIAASPRGVICGKNSEQFISQILQGYQFYRSIGTKSMNISRIDITLLDEIHASARVSWRSIYQKSDGTAVRIDFDVIYLLQWQNGRLKIFAYITGDEKSALQEKGLI